MSAEHTPHTAPDDLVGRVRRGIWSHADDDATDAQEALDSLFEQYAVAQESSEAMGRALAAAHTKITGLEEQLQSAEARLNSGIFMGEPIEYWVGLKEQLDAAEEYADEGWAWLGAALHALGVSHVFEIPDWQENLRKSIAEMTAEKALAASSPAKRPT